ncbi:MAG: hypothetical protein ABFD64_04500 [Armatimonadota bacterium]
MRKPAVLLASLALFVSFSTPAFADLILPSVVKMLMAAGPCSLLLFPMIFTVPLLLCISLIEALIANRFLKRGFGTLFIYLFVINALTSAIGLFTMPKDNIWVTIPPIYLATAVIEGFLLLLVMKRGERKILTGLGVSAVMNAASYAFLSAVIAAAIYLPAASCRDNMPLSDLSGKLILEMHDQKDQTVELPGKYRQSDLSKCYGFDPDLRYGVMNEGENRIIIDKKTGKRLGQIKPGLGFYGCWHFSGNGRFYANRVWKCARLGLDGGDLVVGDTITGRIRAFPKPESQIFSPVDSRLAIIYRCSCTIYNPANGNTKTIGMPCMSSSEEIAWSPDGKYIAYLADMSPYNHDIGDSYMDAVRVISADGKKSVTVRRRQGGFYWWHIEWAE